MEEGWLCARLGNLRENTIFLKISKSIKNTKDFESNNYRTTLHVKKGSFSYAVKITNRELLPICKIYYVANVKIFAHREDEI